MSGVRSLKVSLPLTFPTEHSSPLKGRAVNYSLSGLTRGLQEVIYKPWTSRWRRLHFLKACLRSNRPVSDMMSKRSGATQLQRFNIVEGVDGS